MSVLQKIDTAQREAVNRPIVERLAAGIAPKMLPVFADIHEEIASAIDAQHRAASARRHAEALAQFCLRQSETIAEFQSAERQFQLRIVNAVDRSEERAAILDFARALGASRKQLNSDRKAFGAWFDADAVVERYQKRIGERERVLAHSLERLGMIVAEAVETDPMLVDTAFFVDLSDKLLAEMRIWPGDARIRRAAHLCLASMAAKIHHWPFGVWFETVLSATRRVCFDEKEDAWVQCAAFDALLALSPDSIAGAVRARLEKLLSEKPKPIADSEIFLRRHLVRMLGCNLAISDSFPTLLARLARDEAGVVRQALCDVLHHLPPDAAADYCEALRDDEDPQVRAGIFADVPRFLTVIAPQDYAGHIAHVLAHDEDEFVLRIALDAATKLAAWCRHADGELDHIISALSRSIAFFRERDISRKLLRWADEAFEQVWLASDIEAMEIAAVLHETVRDQREAVISPIPAIAGWLPDEAEKVGRVMAVLAQRDFGLSLKSGRRPSIQRGEWIKRRLWRILFEGGNSATDKRQAHIHTTGRHYHGTMLAPSARMAELAPTKVPGEPLVESSEGGWRNYIPLLDQALSALDHGQILRLFTSAGITELVPPRGLLRRARVFIAITRGYAKLAALRNREPDEFLSALRGHGFAVTFRSYEGVAKPAPFIAAMFGKGGAA